MPLALAAFLAGCANLNVGQPIEQKSIATIVPGRSTKDSIKSTFGNPLHTIHGSDGDIWVYRHLDGKSQQELCVSFNGDVVSVFSHE
jgi:hypothetical protein